MTRETAPACPFCGPATERVFYRGDLVLGLWDAFPASPGHALLVPRRHVAGWFDATLDERIALMQAVDVARAAIEARHRPDGYNLGVNSGAAAGQTVFHLHLHVIPRYDGDVPDPRGGVRHVIPLRGDYLAEAAREAASATGRVPELATGEAHRKAPAEPPATAAPAALVRGGEIDPLLPHLIENLDRAAAVDIAAAFTLDSGVRMLEEHLRDVLDRGGRVRILTGDYLGVTEPAALLRLLDLQGQFELRIFESGGTSFHPKAYILTGAGGEGVAFVGSSNLSATALRSGIEWNYRVVTSRDGAGFGDVVDAFEALWHHPRVRPLDAQWVQGYRARRERPIARVAGVEEEPVGPPPEPHGVQREALAALEAARAQGATAGLVVLATGLGKTWLSAFDSDRDAFRRILFVAHREEILGQAMRTFRAIRPMSTLGTYTGAEKTPEADIVFASIQALGRKPHLHRFDPQQFDYIVVDEFHHAAAQSYRRVINYFEPAFLLGLTATPERTDGGDLLSLCGNNLVYRCDLADGIRRGLLAPFDYYGVPDDVDYSQIPWRSTRFDEAALTAQVATHARARNALEQYRRHGGRRAIGFCVSQRHADFMAESFREAGLRAVAVHSGESSAPRAHSLERLEAGELDIVFAVDMFNEGVDLPSIDSILMLRPTESRILWLQQFGRGLRWQPDKKLCVIDYIGNHRVFLTKTRALFDLGSGDREVALALDRLDAGTLELPPGCSVTYELEAKEILRSLIRSTTTRGGRLEEYYREFRERHGVRPLAVEAYEDGEDPKATRRGFGSWLGFVRAMGDLTPEQEAAYEHLGAFLEQLEVTPMTRSYKMLVLQAMLAEEAFPGGIRIKRLTERFAHFARRYASVRNEVGDALEDPAALRRLIEENPIRAWAGGAGTGGTAYFRYEDGRFSTDFTLPAELHEPARDLVQEIVDWRLTTYVDRHGGEAGADRILCNVSHANGRPILFLPDREKHRGIPEGWRTMLANDEEYQARFVKIAVNVVTRPGSTRNALPDILRGWFGAEAGAPGRGDRVLFVRQGAVYIMRPVNGVDGEERGLAGDPGPLLWRRYSRKEAAAALQTEFQGWEAQSGIVERAEHLMFFVTLDKDQSDERYRYRDRFLSPTEFQWQSQNRTRQASELGRKIRYHGERGVDVHLFVRRRKRAGGRTAPFIYCGRLDFQRWEGEKPITVWWELEETVPERLWGELGVGERQRDA